MKNIYFRLLFFSACFTVISAVTMAADKAGEVRALKGKASIVRAGIIHPVAIRDSVVLADTVETDTDSRAKILFVDDSMLTLGERSRLMVREYLLGDDKKRGQSVFNLIDGKVRVIVGKNKFEVQTPTAVAAARGTVLVAWTKQDSSCIAVFRGIVDASNRDTSIKGTSAISEDNMSCIDVGKPPTAPERIPDELKSQLLGDTNITDTPVMDVPQDGSGGRRYDSGIAVPPAVPPVELKPKLPSPRLNK
jgi:hypothetical protein